VEFRCGARDLPARIVFTGVAIDQRSPLNAGSKPGQNGCKGDHFRIQSVTWITCL
jgi:hypothetical protein